MFCGPGTPSLEEAAIRSAGAFTIAKTSLPLLNYECDAVDRLVPYDLARGDSQHRDEFMVGLGKRLDRVLEKTHFTVYLTRPADLEAKESGGFLVTHRHESGKEMSPHELRELYERSKYAGETTTWVTLAPSKDGDRVMAALTKELRTVLAGFVEPKTDGVGHGLHWIPSRRKLIWSLPSGLQAYQNLSTVAELAEALVIAGSCLGSENACEHVSAWVAGEPLEYRTLTLLPNVDVETELESDGIRIARLPESMSELPSHLPTGVSLPVQQFLGGIVMSVDTRAKPVLFRPESWDDASRKVNPRSVLGDGRYVFDRFCESLSLAAGAYVNRTGLWMDYGDLTAFSFQKASVIAGLFQHETIHWKVGLGQRTLERAWDNYKLRNRSSKNRHSTEKAIDRWMRSMNPDARLVDRFIELRIVLETLYLDKSKGALSYRVAARGARDLGSTPTCRKAYKKILKKAYKLCSRAIHHGSVEKTETNLNVLHDAQKACREGILKRLEQRDISN